MDTIKNQNGTREPIAITGIGCRFPGDACSPEAFWKLMLEQRDAVGEVPSERWNVDAYFHPNRDLPGKIYTRAGAFLEQVDGFDAGFFGISPREASRIDPQHRLLLELTWEALENAGETTERLSDHNVGVFIGICTAEYMEWQYRNIQSINAYTNIGGNPSIAANRISYIFDWHGPSIAMDTACSSSLSALHLACQSIWNGECSVAIVGGVHLLLGPERTVGFAKASMLSTTGRCRAFDSGADGYVRSEGAGVVILKPLSETVDNHDQVYGAILATAINQDGRTAGLSMPNREAQEAILREVYAKAGISPADVQYVEAHGTGTPVGDPIECEALGHVLGVGRASTEPLLIGSVKTNIGHLEGAAGMAGLIKLALSLKHGKIPANLHFDIPNPNIDFEALRLRVPQAVTQWPNGKSGRIGGVASYGFGGTNAHAVLKSVDTHFEAEARTARSTRLHILPISARSQDALKSFAKSYRTQLLQGSGPSLHDLCYTASVRRSHHDHRLALIAQNTEEFVEKLDAFLAGERRSGLCIGKHHGERRPKLAFVFSGNGPQWWAMGRQLLESEPVFREKIATCDQLLRRHAEWSLLEELKASEADSRMHLTEIAQPALFALQAALLDLWRSWGVEPDAVLGHSVGEVGAAYAAGILTCEDAIRVIYHRSRTQGLTAGAGKMAAVELSEEEACKVVADYEGRLHVAAVNAPTSVTLSGDTDAVEAVVEFLTEKGTFCRELRLNYAFHSHCIDQVREDLLRSLDGLQPSRASRRFVSTVTGGDLDGSACGPQHWWDNVRKPVRFARAVDTLIRDGYELFLELGPHPVVASYIVECASANGKEATVVPSLHRKEDEHSVMMGSLGSLYVQGYPARWETLYPRGGQLVPLPAYPWQRERYWYAPDEQTFSNGTPDHPLLGCRLESVDPQWRLELDKRALSYLDDHKVQGSTVFPAAGFVEMGLAAARELFGPGPCDLEELDIPEALVLQESKTATIHTVVHSDGSFEISSQTKGPELEWRTHARGRLVRRSHPDKLRRFSLADIRRRCNGELSAERHYRLAKERGLAYGPCFQGVQWVRFGDGEAIGEVRASDRSEGDPGDYRLHPTFLDACFQVVFSVLPTREPGTGHQTYLPVSIKRLRFLSKPSGSAYTYVKLARTGADYLVVDCFLLDAEGRVLVAVEGFRLKAVQFGNRKETGSRGMLKQLRWQSQPLDGRYANRSAAHLPNLQTLAAVLRPKAERLARDHGMVRCYDIEPRNHELCVGYIVRAFRQLGWAMRAGERITISDFLVQFEILEQHRQLIEQFFAILREERMLRRQGDSWEVVRTCERGDPDELWRTLVAEFPAFHAELTLLGACGRQLVDVLRGEVDPLQLIFAEKSGTLEHLYSSAPTSLFYSKLTREVLAHVATELPGTRTLRVLEIGGGTGGATAHALPALPADRTQYMFTDVSHALLPPAKQRFRAYPFVEYRTLDIERNPDEQGYDPHSFDVILAANVLHATTDLRRILSHVQGLLASEGLLILLETRVWTPVLLIFGLLKSWWRYTDTQLRSYPLLPASRWIQILKEAGFPEAVSISDRPDGAQPIQSLLLAQGARLEDQHRPLPVGQTPAGTWLVFADHSGFGQQLCDRLVFRGQRVISVFHGEGFDHPTADRFTVDQLRPQDMEKIFEVLQGNGVNLRGIIHCWSLDASSPETTTAGSLEQSQQLGCLSVIHLLQGLAKGYLATSPRLWLVTSGAQSVDPDAELVSVAQSPLWGLGRVAVHEQPKLRCTLVDLSPGQAGNLNQDFCPDELQAFVDELFAEQQEEEILLRGPDRYVHRLVEASLDEPAHSRLRQPSPAESYRLEVTTPGLLDSLHFRSIPREKPAAGEVEIEVFATGLNFKDVMQAMGLLSGPALEVGYIGGLSLGFECAGRIVAIGEGVDHLRVGDEVIALGRHCFSRYLTTPSNLVAKKPQRLGFAEAATVPATFITAHYALHNVGRLHEGDRVLIHGAAGGVGMAAIQIVRQAGGEIYATAGTPEKRDYLRALKVARVMDSRSLDFADEIMDHTQGQGVDIVLNSISGEALVRSFNALRPFGRFLELGKRDFLENGTLGLRPFEKCLSFHAIDIDQLLKRDPDLCKSLLQDLIVKFEQGEYHALPFREFSIQDTKNAFRCMQQSKHIGKIVVSMKDGPAPVRSATPGQIRFRQDATYLITGGLGGVGLALAQWMIDNGAKHLALVGRSGLTKPEAVAAVAKMRGAGAEVVAARVDISSEDQVVEFISQLRSSMPPLGGVIHGAMVLEDAILLHLTRDKLMKVMDPKMLGAWHLHMHTRELPLDFFVLLSSGSSLLGFPGQGNYAAACSFLDSLAQYRRGLGLPALVVNWGPLGGVGYVSEHPEVAHSLLRLGMAPVPIGVVLDTLGKLMANRHSHMAVVDVDFEQWCDATGIRSSKLKQLVQTNGRAKTIEPSHDYGSLLRGATADERQQLVKSRLCEMIADVLGTSTSKLDLEKPVALQGLDSLMAVDLRLRIERDMRVEVPVMALVGAESISDLAATVALELEGNQATADAISVPRSQ